MRPSPGNPVEEFEELRGLLFGRERDQLRDLRDRVSNKERRSRDVAGVLPDAVKRTRKVGDELARALRPAVEGSITESIQSRPQTFVDALHPLVGPILRRSMAESLRRVFQSRTLVYRVEQVFLVHRETSLALLHVTADSVIAKDSDTVEMLRTIRDFAWDSFKTTEDAALVEFRAGERQIWIMPGRQAYLAAVIRGEPPRDLRIAIKETLESLHLLKGPALSSFEGDAAGFESFRTELEGCLRAQYSVSTGWSGRKIVAWTTLGGVAAAMTCALLLAARSQAHWLDFLRQLKAQPGIVVTEARKGWISPSEVTGLRDHSSADPAGIALAAKVDSKKVRFHWKEFLALDSASIRKRFEDRFGIPLGVQATIADGALTLSGSVPYEWLERVRREATFVPGIGSLVDRDANVSYDPKLVLERFEEKFEFPKTVRGALVKNVLILSGRAPRKWLTRVRSEGTTVPGISGIEEQKLIDLDQQTFQQAKTAIENTFVSFPRSKDEFTPEDFVALFRLQDKFRQCEKAGEQIDEKITLEINGYADPTENVVGSSDLSQRRAEKVRDFLLSSGFDSSQMRAVGMGDPAKAVSAGLDAPKQVGNRVAFKVNSSRVLLP